MEGCSQTVANIGKLGLIFRKISFVHHPALDHHTGEFGRIKLLHLLKGRGETVEHIGKRLVVAQRLLARFLIGRTGELYLLRRTIQLGFDFCRHLLEHVGQTVQHRLGRHSSVLATNHDLLDVAFHFCLDFGSYCLEHVGQAFEHGC